MIKVILPDCIYAFAQYDDLPMQSRIVCIVIVLHKGKEADMGERSIIVINESILMVKLDGEQVFVLISVQS